MLYDVAIIGLGPSGATLARLLDKSLKVIAIDKKDHSCKGGFQKPCGGLLATDAQKSLSKFNLALPKDILVDPQLFAVKTIDFKQNLMRYYQRFYVNMDRHRFDLWLIGLIGSNVEIKDNSNCISIKKRSGYYEISYKKDKSLYTVEAKYIVGADGANSVVRRSLFPKKNIRSYVSIQQWYADKNLRPLYSCFFDSDVTDCYAWGISKDGYFILGGAFPAENCRKRFEMLKRRLESKGYFTGDALKTEACIVLRPSGFFDQICGRDGAFLAGEAAGFISPSSLEGISYAFDSAQALADSLNSNNKDPVGAYRVKMLGMRAKLCLKNAKSIFMYVPLARKLVMKSGLMSIDVVPDGTN